MIITHSIADVKEKAESKDLQGLRLGLAVPPGLTVSRVLSRPALRAGLKSSPAFQALGQDRAATNDAATNGNYWDALEARPYNVCGLSSMNMGRL